MFTLGQSVKHTASQKHGIVTLLCLNENKAWVKWNTKDVEWVSFADIEGNGTLRAIDIIAESLLSEKESKDAADEFKADKKEKEEKTDSEDNSLIGQTVDGITLTKSGFRQEDTGWWFFPRLLKTGNDKEHGVYWYKKKRVDTGDEDGKIVDKYVCTDMAELPFKVPGEFIPYMNKVILDIRGKVPARLRRDAV